MDETVNTVQKETNANQELRLRVSRLEEGNRALRTTLQDVSCKTETPQHQDRLQDAIEYLTDGFALYGPDERLIVCNK